MVRTDICLTTSPGKHRVKTEARVYQLTYTIRLVLHPNMTGRGPRRSSVPSHRRAPGPSFLLSHCESLAR
jgi:hypothetical protein